MKTIILTVLAMSLAVPAVFAEVSAPAKEPDRPCQRIEQACKDAGFVRGGVKEGKGLIYDCVKPILEDKSVLGVNVDTATRQACRDNVKAKQERDKAKAEADKAKAEADKAKAEAAKKKAAPSKKKTAPAKSK